MSIPYDYKPEYLLAFGHIEAEWNQLEALLFVVFRHFIGTRSASKANAVFFSQVNHRARREMVESLGPIVLARAKGKKRKFAALMRRMKNAGQKRNEVIHTFWGWQNGVPWAIWPEQSDSDLIEKDLLRELRTRAQTIKAVRDDLRAFYHSLQHVYGSWPYKRPQPGDRRPEWW